MQKVLLMSAAAFFLVACNNTTPAAQPSTSAEPAKTAATAPTRAPGVWIDVRSPEEYAEGHLSGALNITADDLAAQIASIEPNKDAPINLYCRTGRRAEVARTILTDLGYTNVTNHGGYQALYDQGLR